MLEHIKRKVQFNFNLKDIEKRIKETSTYFKKFTTDTTLLYLMK